MAFRVLTLVLGLFLISNPARAQLAGVSAPAVAECAAASTNACVGSADPRDATAPSVRDVLQALTLASPDVARAFLQGLVGEIAQALKSPQCAEQAPDLLNAIFQITTTMGIDPQSADGRDLLRPIAEALSSSEFQERYAQRLVGILEQVRAYLTSIVSSSPAANFVGMYLTDRISRMNRIFRSTETQVYAFRNSVRAGDYRSIPLVFAEDFNRFAGLIGLINDAQQFARDMNYYRTGMQAALAMASTAVFIPLGPVAFIVGGALTTATIYAGSGATWQQTAVASLTHVVTSLIGMGVLRFSSPALTGLFGRVPGFALAGGLSGGISSVTVINIYALAGTGNFASADQMAVGFLTGFGIGFVVAGTTAYLFPQVGAPADRLVPVTEAERQIMLRAIERQAQLRANYLRDVEDVARLRAALEAAGNPAIPRGCANPADALMSQTVNVKLPAVPIVID